MKEKSLEKRLVYNQITFYEEVNDFDDYFFEKAGFYEATIEDIKKIKKKALEYIELLEKRLYILKKRYKQLNEKKEEI